MAVNPSRTPDMSCDSEEPRSPIALFGPAQFWCDSDFSDDEAVLTMREKLRSIQARFLPELPLEIAEGKIWPLVVDSADIFVNYKTCTTMRCVCVGWRNFVGRQSQWSMGSLALEMRAYLDANEISSIFRDTEKSVPN